MTEVLSPSPFPWPMANVVAKERRRLGMRLVIKFVRRFLLLSFLAFVVAGCSQKPVDRESGATAAAFVLVDSDGPRLVGAEISESLEVGLPDGLDVERVALLSDALVVESAGSVLRADGDRLQEVAIGTLLGTDRTGDRIATVMDGIISMGIPGKSVDVPIDCIGEISGVWDGSNTVLGVVCGVTMYVVSDTGIVFSKQLPGYALDITNWGEGFAVLVRTSSGRYRLYRTPCHEQRLFGLLYEFDIEVTQVVGGIESEWLVLRTTDGKLQEILPHGGRDDVATAVRFVGETPGIVLNHECGLGSVKVGG